MTRNPEHRFERIYGATASDKIKTRCRECGVPRRAHGRPR